MGAGIHEWEISGLASAEFTGTVYGYYSQNIKDGLWLKWPFLAKPRCSSSNSFHAPAKTTRLILGAAQDEIQGRSNDFRDSLASVGTELMVGKFWLDRPSGTASLEGSKNIPNFVCKAPGNHDIKQYTTIANV